MPLIAEVGLSLASLGSLLILFVHLEEALFKDFTMAFV